MFIGTAILYSETCRVPVVDGTLAWGVTMGTMSSGILNCLYNSGNISPKVIVTPLDMGKKVNLCS